MHSDSAIEAQPKKPSTKEVTISKPVAVEMTVNSVPFTKAKMTKQNNKKNDPKQNLLRQTKYFDHSKYHDVPSANDIPMDLFDWNHNQSSKLKVGQYNNSHSLKTTFLPNL